MKNPYVAALYPFISDPDLRTAGEFLDLSGQNVGNFMFSASIRRLVKSTTKTRKLTVNLKTIAEECDGIVIAAANWLQPKNDFSGLASQIEAADVPTVLTGIGAQTFEGRMPELQPGTVRMLKAISDRCHSISVRGPFSAEVLEHYGIHNVTVTGCPSLLYHLNHPAEITRLPDPARLGRVSFNGTVPGRTVPKHETDRMALGRLVLGEAVRQGRDYVVQTELPMLRAARNELPDSDTETWDFLHNTFGTEDRSWIQNYVKRHIHVFGSVPDWLAYCANHDMVIGTRLHGVIAGLLAGTPSVLISHDTRTEEMGKFAAIPTVPASEIMEIGRIDPQALFKKADFAAFNARQKEYFAAFADFFDANGVPHRLSRA